MKRKSGLFKATAVALIILALIISLSVSLIEFTRAEVEPKVWTDKNDYSPGETVTIYGEGFTPSTTITITIQRPDDNKDILYTESNSRGGFAATYRLDGIEGEYAVTAVDKYGKMATTVFTDCHGGGSITIEIFGYTLSPKPRWTTGVVKGYLEDQWIPFKIEVESSKSGSYSLNITVHLDYYSSSYGYGLDNVMNFRMWRNGVSETPNINGPSPDGWEDGGKIQQLQFSWTFTVNKNDNCTLYFEAHVAIGAHNYPGARIHVHIHSITSNPNTPVSQGNKEVPVQIGYTIISGYKWNDKDGDGIKDCNEPRLGGWTINLYKLEGSAWVHVESTNTANNGRYSFKVYCAGIYIVNETIKNGWTQTFPGNNSYVINVSRPGEYSDKNFGNKEGVPPQEYPSISIDKSANATMAHVGDTIEYTYNVINTGNVNLTNIQVTDNVTLTPTYVSGDDGDYILEPGETWTYKSTYKVKAGDPTLLVNNATVTASYGGQQISAWDTYTIVILRPAIRVEKSANVSRAYAGNIIEYTINVTNTGDCELYNVNVTDTLLGIIWTGSLESGESKLFKFTYIIEAGDPDPLNNAVIAYGYDELGMRVESDATCSIDLVAKICGYKFHDTNKDGTRNSGEEGLGGWTIKLFKWNETAWELINSTTTDPNGFYCFDNLDAGRYNVTEVLQAGWRNTTSTSIIIELKSGEISQDNNFGNIRQHTLSVYTSPSGLSVLINGTLTNTPSILSYDYCTWINLTAPNIIQNSSGIRYVFLYWNINGINHTNNQIMIHMNASYTATAYYTTQYYLTVMDNIGGLSGVSGQSGWYDNCTYISALTAPRYVNVSDVERYAFIGWNVTFPLHMDSPKAVVAIYTRQYLVTFNQTGLDGTATGIVVNINGTDVHVPELPYDLWVDEGGRVTFSYYNVSSIMSGKRFILESVNATSPITVNKPMLIVGNYKTQYLLTIGTNGLPDSSNATGVYLDGTFVGWAYDGSPFTKWFDEGASTGTIGVDNAIGLPYRYIFVRWDDGSRNNPRASETMNEPKTFTAIYGVPPTEIVTIIASPTEAQGGKFKVTYVHLGILHKDEEYTTPYYLSVDPNTNVTVTWVQEYVPNEAGVSGARYKFIGYSPSNNINVSETTTIILEYKKQYKITFKQNGIGTEWTDVVLTVNGRNYKRSELPVSVWCDEGSTLSFAWNSPLVVSRTKAYVWYRTTGLSYKQSDTITVNSSGEIVGYYRKEKPPVVPPAGIGGCKTKSKRK